MQVDRDAPTSTSCVLIHDSETVSQCSYTLFCTSVCLTLYCFHSCWQIPVLRCCGQPHASTLFLLTVTLEMCPERVCSTSEQLLIFECCDFAMHGSRRRFSAQFSTVHDLDFCTSLAVLECRVVNVCRFRNFLAWVCCTPRTLRHVSHLGPYVACLVLS